MQTAHAWAGAAPSSGAQQGAYAGGRKGRRCWAMCANKCPSLPCSPVCCIRVELKVLQQGTKLVRGSQQGLLAWACHRGAALREHQANFWSSVISPILDQSGSSPLSRLSSSTVLPLKHQLVVAIRSLRCERLSRDEPAVSICDQPNKSSAALQAQGGAAAVLLRRSGQSVNWRGQTGLPTHQILFNAPPCPYATMAPQLTHLSPLARTGSGGSGLVYRSSSEVAAQLAALREMAQELPRTPKSPVRVRCGTAIYFGGPCASLPPPLLLQCIVVGPD